MDALGEQWVDQVTRLCDPVFEAADVGFVRQVSYADDASSLVSALLWEADPRRFAERYPDSGIVESYGEDQWPGVTCVDYWAYVDQEERRCDLSVEGWGTARLRVDLSGDGRADGAALAAAFARILRVPPPTT